MIQAIIILVCVIIAISCIGFFVIKKLINDNKDLHFKLDNAENRIDFYQKNRQAYDSVIEKLTKGKKNADKIREKVNNSNGSDLSDILNEL